MTVSKVCFFYLDGLAPGGYPRDMRWLAGGLIDRGVDVTVLARPGSQSDGLGGADVSSDQDRWPDLVRHTDLLHVFGFSEPAQLKAARALSQAAPATVVSPLVHLMTEHVRVGSWKKRPAYLVAGRVFRRTTGHFFSEIERQEARRYYDPPRSFLAGAGLFPATDAPADASRDGDYLLFFGRNDVHQKGLDRLLEGYAEAVRAGFELPLVIAGRAQGDSDTYLRAAAARLGLTTRIELVGERDDRGRDALMRGARTLVFLSRWDGPPRPVREAIAVGLPVIVSRGTNTSELVAAHGAGVEAGDSPSEVAAALLRAADADEVERWRRGVTRLQETMSWSVLAQDFLTGYSLAVG